jgi:NMD protein affecting ribosome stability and mRNA decay
VAHVTQCPYCIRFFMPELWKATCNVAP